MLIDSIFSKRVIYFWLGRAWLKVLQGERDILVLVIELLRDIL
jgi:hypothetical protein